MKTFKAFVDKEQPFKPFLGICHICDIDCFRSILRTNELEANSEFKYVKDESADRVSYFFYGRPAYRISEPEEPNQILAYCPVCFVLKYDDSTSIKRIFPFDTGEFHSDVSDYFRFFHKSRKLIDFELNSHVDTPAKVVKLFYGDNTNYYNIEPVKDLKIPGLLLEVLEYYDLIRDRGKNRLDDRKATVELQVDINISISERNLEYIVIPYRYLDDDEVKAKLTSDWCLPLDKIGTYTQIAGSPIQYASVIIEKVQEYYKKKGLI